LRWEEYQEVEGRKRHKRILSEKNGLKQGDALSQLLFNVALEYAIRKVQKN
jgi:hypothetical protein